jgi:predicted transcriptional regulator
MKELMKEIADEMFKYLKMVLFICVIGVGAILFGFVIIFTSPFLALFGELTFERIFKR